MLFAHHTVTLSSQSQSRPATLCVWMCEYMRLLCRRTSHTNRNTTVVFVLCVCLGHDSSDSIGHRAYRPETRKHLLCYSLLLADVEQLCCVRRTDQKHWEPRETSVGLREIQNRPVIVCIVSVCDRVFVCVVV